MSYSNIKRFLSAVMIMTFTATMTPAFSAVYSTSPSPAAMTLSGNVRLTESNDKITLSLRDSDVKQVLRMFADKAGMNIVFHESVSGKVTLDLVETPINEAFNLVLQIAGLNYYKQGNTMIVMAAGSEANAAYSKQEMLVYPIKYVSATKIANFLNQNVFGMKKAGMSSVDAATVNSATNELIVFGMPSDAPIIEKVIAQFDREPFTRTYSVNHTTPAEMANMICNMLLPSRGIGDGKVTGGAASLSDGGGELKLGEGVVACSASTTSSGSIAPFDLQSISVAYYPQRGTITLMGGSESQAAMVEKFIKDNDLKQPQAMLELSIIELNESGSKEFQNQWQVTGKHWFLTFDGSRTGAGRMNKQPYTTSTEYMWSGGSNGIYEAQGDGSYTLTGWEGGQPNGLPYVLDGVMNIPTQILRSVQEQLKTPRLQWFINYLVENRKGRVLANPKIMITNGQESVIDLTSDYVEKVTKEYLTSSVNGTGSTGTAQTTYSIGNDLGIKVTLTPFISPDGYVTLNITPDYSTVANEVADENGNLAATLLSRRNLDLKNIRIRDGETLVIGGMIQETELKSVRKLPFLGDLPLVGPAFRSSSTNKTKTELIIMITPQILQDGDDGAISRTL